VSDARVVVVSVGELAVIIDAAVRKALDERGTTERVAADQELTIAQVVELMQLSKRYGKKTIWRWRRTLGFPAPHRRGNRVRWLRTEIDAWRAAQGTSGPGAVTSPEPPGRRRKTPEAGATLPH
jgi:predicted DNA-binding transcriptional regulator AlpA